MREELNVVAEKVGDIVKIKVQGTCTDNLVYAVVSSLLEALAKGERINDN